MRTFIQLARRATPPYLELSFGPREQFVLKGSSQFKGQARNALASASGAMNEATGSKNSDPPHQSQRRAGNTGFTEAF